MVNNMIFNPILSKTQSSSANAIIQNFTTEQWDGQDKNYTITIPGNVNGENRTTCEAMELKEENYVRTWGALQTYATISENNIVLHSQAPYNGYAVISLYTWAE